MNAYVTAINDAVLIQQEGRVLQSVGMTVEVRGLEAAVGDLCRIQMRRGTPDLQAEVVAVRPSGLVLMAYGALDGIAAGDKVHRLGRRAAATVGDGLLGRVIDGFCHPLDGKPAPELPHSRPLRPAPLNPMSRTPITQLLQTGVRAIDGLLPLGQGQRIGVFAGSGVGKSTLLGMAARSVQADVNVIALIGERGREVRDFIERQMEPETLRRSVIVVATSDQPALMRLRATYLALAVAEYFRDQGKQVFLTMDSVTRFAMARREIGLAAGEPPTARGYTPSVFTEIPQLCERCGCVDGGGSISAIFTVLVEGDDFNEPVADSLRATLDGHIVLTRELANRGHFPAIDILQSASRLLPELASESEWDLVRRTVQCLSLLERNRQLVDIGAYQAGSNPLLDDALQRAEPLAAWLRQNARSPEPRPAALRALRAIMDESRGKDESIA